MSEEINELQRRERAAEAMLREARELRERAEREELDRKMEAFKPLAVAAHEACCQWNHTDGCGWGYEVRDGAHCWAAPSHSRWLAKVAEIVNGRPSTSYGYGTPGIPSEVVAKVIATITALRSDSRDAIPLLKSFLTGI